MNITHTSSTCDNDRNNLTEDDLLSAKPKKRYTNLGVHFTKPIYLKEQYKSYNSGLQTTRTPFNNTQPHRQYCTSLTLIHYAVSRIFHNVRITTPQSIALL
jgi:hypothetical protein